MAVEVSVRKLRRWDTAPLPPARPRPSFGSDPGRNGVPGFYYKIHKLLPSETSDKVRKIGSDLPINPALSTIKEVWLYFPALSYPPHPSVSGHFLFLHQHSLSSSSFLSLLPPLFLAPVAAVSLRKQRLCRRAQPSASLSLPLFLPHAVPY